MLSLLLGSRQQPRKWLLIATVQWNRHHPPTQGSDVQKLGKAIECGQHEGQGVYAWDIEIKHAEIQETFLFILMMHIYSCIWRRGVEKVTMQQAAALTVCVSVLAKCPRAHRLINPPPPRSPYPYAPQFEPLTW